MTTNRPPPVRRRSRPTRPPAADVASPRPSGKQAVTDRNRGEVRRRGASTPPAPAHGPAAATAGRDQPPPTCRQACFRRQSRFRRHPLPPAAARPGCRRMFPGCRSAPAWPAAPWFSPCSGSRTWSWASIPARARSMPGWRVSSSASANRRASPSGRRRYARARRAAARLAKLEAAAATSRPARPIRHWPTASPRSRGRSRRWAKRLHPRPPHRRGRDRGPRRAPACRGDRRRARWPQARERRGSSVRSSRRSPIAWPRSSAARRQSRPSSPSGRRDAGDRLAAARRRRERAQSRGRTRRSFYRRARHGEGGRCRSEDSDPARSLEPFATTGVPTAAALARELAALAPSLQQATSTPPRDGGFLEKLQAGAEKLVRIRPIGESRATIPPRSWRASE